MASWALRQHQVISQCIKEQTGRHGATVDRNGAITGGHVTAPVTADGIEPGSRVWLNRQSVVPTCNGYASGYAAVVPWQWRPIHAAGGTQPAVVLGRHHEAGGRQRWRGSCMLLRAHHTLPPHSGAHRSYLRLLLALAVGVSLAVTPAAATCYFGEPGKTLLNCTDIASGADLDLSGQGITSVACGAFAGATLRQLDLSGNSLTTLHPCMWEGLAMTGGTVAAEVLLNDNSIDALCGGVFNETGWTLRYLALQSNSLTYMEPQAFSGMTVDELFLQSNNLANLANGTFSGLNVHTTLALNNNQLLRVDHGAFEGLLSSGGTTLNLEYNTIASIGDGAFSGLVLDTLRIEFNPLASLNASMWRGLSVDTLFVGGAYTTLPAFSFSGLSVTKLKVRAASLVHVDAQAMNGLFFRQGGGGSAEQGLELRQNSFTTLPRQLLWGIRGSSTTFIVRVYANYKLRYLPPGFFFPPPPALKVATADLHDSDLQVFTNCAYTSSVPGDKVYVGSYRGTFGPEDSLVSGYCSPCTMDNVTQTLTNCSAFRGTDLLVPAWGLHRVNHDALAGLDLTSIDMSHNSDLQGLPRTLFTGMAQPPSAVDLSDCGLAYLPPRVFAPLPPGATVDLEGNLPSLLAPCAHVGGNHGGQSYCSPCTVVNDTLVSCSGYNGSHLDLREWSLSHVEHGALSGVSATSVDMSHNDMLTALPGGLFRGMVKPPSAVDLSDCGLAYLPPRVFAPLPPGATVDLSGNPTSLFQPCAHSGSVGSITFCSPCTVVGDILTSCSGFDAPRLDLSSWGLRGVVEEAMVGVNATVLDLSDNRLESLPRHLFSMAEWPPAKILLVNNDIAYLPAEVFSALPAGATVEVAGNPASLTASGCAYAVPSVAIGQPYCSPCDVDNGFLVSCAGFPSDSLYLQAWGLTTISQTALHGLSLASLDMSHNSLEGLPLVLFREMVTAPSDVDLSYNELHAFPPGVFAPLPPSAEV